MKIVVFFLAFFLLIGCKKEPNKKVIITENKQYKQSEMAALMLNMYAVSLENKKLILEGKKPQNFPEEFLNIHKATLTDPSDRDAAFKTFSDYYLKSFKDVFNAPTNSLIVKHNVAINSCISCHKTTCIGPIPKIKKLLIP